MAYEKRTVLPLILVCLQHILGSPPCSCFSTCDVASTAAFKQAIPEQIETPDSPWYGYLRAVYGPSLTLPFDLGRVNFFYHHDDQTWARRFPRVEWPMSSCRIPVPTMNLQTGLSVVEAPRCDVTACSRWLQPKDAQHQPTMFAISQTHAMPNADYNESVGVVMFGETIGAGAVASRFDLGRHPVGQGEWAEVIRRSDDMIFPPGHEGTNGYGCWFFPAIGSGIWVNTGKTLQLRYRKDIAFGGGGDIVSRWLQMHSLASEQNFTKQAGTVELSSEAMGLLPPGMHRETFPIMAHELGYDSIQIQNGGELVMTSIECMFQSRPIRACAPAELGVRFGWMAAEVCCCVETVPLLSCEVCRESGFYGRHLPLQTDLDQPPPQRDKNLRRRNSLQPKNITTRKFEFCTHHWCKERCCRNARACKSVAPRMFLYAHVEKTGGSAIECASQPLVRAGIWVNLGHTTTHYINSCYAVCPKPSILIVSVRDPLQYYISMYHYTRRRINSGCLITMQRMMPEAQVTAILSSFSQFTHWVFDNSSFSQHSRLTRTCGSPCIADEVLHLETLSDDWRALAAKYHLDLPELQRINNSTRVKHYDTSLYYNPLLTKRVWQEDREIFLHYGYQLFQDPSEWIHWRVPAKTRAIWRAEWQSGWRFKKKWKHTVGKYLS